jgi:D-glucosaminate-6-phosphate ammonia-lyase
MNGIGRTMKVSKEQIVGLVTALEIYAESDPYVRLNKWIDKLDFIRKELLDVPGIRIKRSPEQPELSTVPILEIQLDEQELGFNSRDIVKALKGWDPPIVLDIDFWIHFRKQAIFVNPSCLQDSEEVIVANALKRVLTDRTTLKELLSEIPRINAVAYP